MKNSPSRDPRLDFFRGLALWVMSIDHAEELASTQLVSYFTYAPIGVSTAAEVFIFLSGFTLGLAYQTVYRVKGYWLLHFRCLTRAWQLYVMHVLCFVIVIAACFAIAKSYGGEAMINVSNGTVWRFATLQAQPTYFDILPLYIVFLCFLPPFFPLLNYSKRIGVAVSIMIYLVAQLAVVFEKTELLPFSKSMYYNPIAWQLLFVIGIALGIRKRNGGEGIRIPHTLLYAMIAVLVVVAFWYKGVRLNALFGWFGPVEYVKGSGIPFDLPSIQKDTLGVFRLIHFLACAAITAYLVPARWKVWDSKWTEYVMVCGRNALEVFVVGVILNYIAAAYMGASGGGRVMMLAVDIVTIVALVLVAKLVAYRKSEPWKA